MRYIINNSKNTAIPYKMYTQYKLLNSLYKYLQTNRKYVIVVSTGRLPAYIQ